MRAPGGVLLDFRDVHTHYGSLHVLKGVSYEIREGEIVSLLGGNASGKSTTMKTVLGLVRPSEGTVSFRGQPIHALRTSEIVRRGIAPVPEGRRVFPRMTILENLEMGRYTRRTGCSASFRSSGSAATSWPARCRAASSRCSPSAGR
jgi:branched-chain amino acid transport system ATP-binding protein